MELMTTAEVAALFRVKDATVRYWRHMGYGPRWAKVGKRVLYNRTDVDKWWEVQRRLA